MRKGRTDLNAFNAERLPESLILRKPPHAMRRGLAAWHSNLLSAHPEEVAASNSSLVMKRPPCSSWPWMR